MIVRRSWLKDSEIKNIEKQYESKYIVDTPLKLKGGGLANQGFAIFYNEIPHPRGSNWFAVYNEFNPILGKTRIMITNAKEVEGSEIQGIEVDGKIYYSTYQNDYVSIKDKENNMFFIDGGREYTRTNDSTKLVNLIVTKEGLIKKTC